MAEALLFPHITHPKKRALLAAFAKTGQLSQAARAARMDDRMHWHWLKKDPAYAAAFVEAQHMVGDMLEQEAIRRAKKGSDTLLIFLLKGAMPAKYRERYEHTGDGGGPLTVRVIYEEGRSDADGA